MGRRVRSQPRPTTDRRSSWYETPPATSTPPAGQKGARDPRGPRLFAKHLFPASSRLSQPISQSTAATFYATAPALAGDLIAMISAPGKRCVMVLLLRISAAVGGSFLGAAPNLRQEQREPAEHCRRYRNRAPSLWPPSVLAVLSVFFLFLLYARAFCDLSKEGDERESNGRKRENTESTESTSVTVALAERLARVLVRQSLAPADVRFTSNSRHQTVWPPCPLSARFGHRPVR